MIVISGALVLVALVLLIIGVVGPDLAFVYASIAVSLVSLVFLVVGILQRRGETPATAEVAPAPTPEIADAAGVTAVIPSQAARASMRKVAQEEPPAAATAAEEPATAGSVLVVEGRPRYHVEGCRYLSGKSAEAVDVTTAREDGFSPCGVCKPDEALAAAAQAQPLEQELAEPTAEPVVEEPVVEEDVPGVEVAPARAARKSTASRRTTAARAASSGTSAQAAATKTPAKAPAKAAPARKAVPAPAAKAPARAAVKAAPLKAGPAKAGPAKAGPAKAGPAKAGSARPAPAAAAPAKAAAGRAGAVVVIPDRGRFHKADCRFVRDAEDTEVMSKAAASRSGYVACGVCKP